MRTTVTFLLLCFFSTLLLATHNRAGEIIYTQIAPLTIEATIITYTQTSTVQADRDSLTICWGDGTCETVTRSNGDGEPIENDYKINAYTSVHVYTALGNYTLSMTDPNRNGSILNVNPPNSDQVQFHLQTTFTLRNLLLEGGSNQSPTLLIAPIDVGFVRQPFMHTPNAIDLDGDSVAYELVTPLMGNDESVPNYMAIDQIGAGTANTYTFNEQTGLLVWDSPQIVGQYNIAIKIKAFRGEELTAEIIRDMQILIKPETNTPPFIQGINENLINIKAEQTIDLSFIGTDNEDGMGDLPPKLSLISETLIKGATTEYSETFEGTSVSDFNWTPTLNDIRRMPYQITVKAVDSKGFATFKVILIQVIENTTSIPLTFQQLGFNLFPNPATTQAQLALPANQVNQAATIRIFDNLGRLVQQKQIESSLSRELLDVTNLPRGQYSVQIQTATATASTLLIIQ